MSAHVQSPRRDRRCREHGQSRLSTHGSAEADLRKRRAAPDRLHPDPLCPLRQSAAMAWAAA